jgi:hypothetical protein
VYCNCGLQSWVNNKDLYSDKFLDQEIDIEIPDVLTKEEHDYLEGVINQGRNDVGFIIKHTFPNYLEVVSKDNSWLGSLSFHEYLFEKMEDLKPYTLEDLGL